jgi:hypothetical protein
VEEVAALVQGARDKIMKSLLPFGRSKLFLFIIFDLKTFVLDRSRLMQTSQDSNFKLSKLFFLRGI